jgi:uncharacterized protein
MGSKHGVSRRRFLQGVATAAASVHVASASVPSAEVNTPSRERLNTFTYFDVKLSGGPLADQFRRIHQAYLGLDNNDLLKPFRRRAGLPDPGKEMGGWYDGPSANNPGQTFGQYLSGLARFAAATGDPGTIQKVKDLVAGFAATVGPDGYSYADVEASTFAPAYDLDKNEMGLIDSYRWARVQLARPLLGRVIRGAVRYLPSHAYERDEAPRQSPVDEPYTLPENLFLSYEVTGDDYFLKLAKRYLMDKTYFDPLSRGVNVLPGLHAYSHVNALSSAAKAYQVLGEQKYFDAIRNAWEMIVDTQEFASGGWGPNELFVEPDKGLLGESLVSSHHHFETPCGSYAHCKLARYLIGFTGEARYGDGLERIVYNTVLGAKDPNIADGNFFYYSDYQASTEKVYYWDKYPCCSGTLPEVVADYTLDCYFHNADGLYVNLFVPSEVRWEFRGMPIKLTQTTEYPERDSSELRIEVPSPVEFTVYVRIPGWLQSPAQLAVNGRATSVPAEPRSFAAIRRRWRTNDTIQIRLPFSFRREPIDEQHPDTVALMWGPLMLVALDRPLEIPRTSISPESLKPAPYSSLAFEVQEAPRRLRFLPFYRVQDEVYTTYFRQI